jgi:hypothetical protein
MALIEIRRQRGRTVDKNLLKTFQRLKADYLWVLKNEEKLRKSYGNKYVAVENQTVRFVDDSIEGLTSKIIDSNGHVEDYAIQYIGKSPVNLLF